MNDTDRALAALEKHQYKRSRFFLLRSMGEETEYMEIGGHIFHEDPPMTKDPRTNKWCQDSGCEMTHPAFAESRSCPASYEGVEQLWVDYDDRNERMAQWEEEHNWGTGEQ